MGWLVDYINTCNLWDVLYTDYCQIVFKGAIIESINYIFYEPIINHLMYHYWEQLNILEVNNGGNT